LRPPTAFFSPTSARPSRSSSRIAAARLGIRIAKRQSGARPDLARSFPWPSSLSLRFLGLPTHSYLLTNCQVLQSHSVNDCRFLCIRGTCQAREHCSDIIEVCPWQIARQYK
jgi:hypothetical protein